MSNRRTGVRTGRLDPPAQDLHIHTTFSRGDSAVVPEQTAALVARVGHAQVIGISDHLEYLIDVFPAYRREVRKLGLKLGTEVDGSKWVGEAEALEFDYYIYHCRDRKSDYRGIEKLLATGKPVVIAHPLTMGTDLNRIPPDCLVEINNRYIWRHNWKKGLAKYVSRFRYILSSDAHQPHWLNQNAARCVAESLGIRETLLFPDPSGQNKIRNNTIIRTD